MISMILLVGILTNINAENVTITNRMFDTAVLGEVFSPVPVDLGNLTENLGSLNLTENLGNLTESMGNPLLNLTENDSLFHNITKMLFNDDGSGHNYRFVMMVHYLITMVLIQFVIMVNWFVVAVNKTVRKSCLGFFWKDIRRSLAVPVSAPLLR